MSDHSAAVKRAIQALERSGKLTAHDVVRAARNPESPLHSCFEWDDSKAAEQWRLEQARSLIRSVEVRITVQDGGTVSVPVYVRDPARDTEEQGYTALESIKGDPDAARAMLYVEMTRVEGLLSRAEGIAAACGLGPQVERLAKRTKALRRMVAPPAQA